MKTQVYQKVAMDVRTECIIVTCLDQYTFYPYNDRELWLPSLIKKLLYQRSIRILGQLWLYMQLKVNLGRMRLCLKCESLF